MPLFRVVHYEDGAGGNRMVHEEVEALDAQAAAEMICGGPLQEGGKPGQLRAQVQPKDDANVKRMFYVA